ncbi:MAG: homocysteine S-methyltransferase family protein [bacterium]|nr:homocysteine S-methyltransferase family protein [bacterium]
MSRSSLDWLKRLNIQGPVLLDGGTGSLLWERKGKAGGNAGAPSSLFNLTDPGIVETVHREFVAASSQVLVTNSFGAVSRYLQQFGMAGRQEEINVAAVTLARRGASGALSEVLIAGSIGPLPPDLPDDEVRSLFSEQARTLIQAGVDLLLCETMMSGRQAAEAAKAVKRVMAELDRAMPLVVSMVPPPDRKPPDDWAAVSELLTAGEIDLFGLNCGEGPDAIWRVLDRLDKEKFGPYWIKASAGLPRVMDGKLVYPISPEQFAGEVAEIVKSFPVVAVGGCCGASPQHIHSLGAVLHRTTRVEV